MATLKKIGQEVAEELGLTVPDSLVGNTEQTARKILRCLNRGGQHLALRDWDRLTFEHTFVTNAGQLAYALPTSPAFHHLKVDTAFDRTQYRELLGNQTAQHWQYGEAALVVSGGLEHRYRIKAANDSGRDKQFYLLDDPAGAFTLAYEYVTREWVKLSAGGFATTIHVDGDEAVFDDDLMHAETLWRLLRANGEQYFDEKDEAMRAADTLYGSENPSTVRMRPRRLRFHENIPEGNWS